MHPHDPRRFTDNVQMPFGGSNGGGWDGGEPSWAAGMRADIRNLGEAFSAGIRTQTLVVAILACVAMCLNAALVLASMTFSANTSGVQIQTQQP